MNRYFAEHPDIKVGGEAVAQLLVDPALDNAGHVRGPVLVQQLGIETQSAVMLPRERRDGRVAISPERREQRSLGVDAAGCDQVTDRAHLKEGDAVVGADLHPDSALRRGGQHDVERDGGAYVRPVQPIEAGGGEQRGIDVSGPQLGQPRIDIAPEQHDPEVRAAAEQLRAPAG